MGEKNISQEFRLKKEVRSTSSAVGSTSSTVGLKTWAITAAVKKYETIIQKKKRSMIKEYCQQKVKKVLISRDLIDSHISGDEFSLVNNVSSEFDGTKEAIKKDCRVNQNVAVLFEVQKKTKLIILSKCAICGSKKSKFMKEQEAGGLLVNLGIKIALSQIPLEGFLLFERYKMNKRVKSFY